MIDESYVADYFDHFLQTTQDDAQAAAILTLAKVIGDFDGINVYLGGGIDANAIQVEAKVEQQSD